MLTIDGAMGEGGGQVLRSSLSLSLCTGQPFRIINIRAHRDKPGLRRQHLMAVKAAAQISNGKVTGADLGSQELSFTPGEIMPGDYHFDIGSAGSTTLVLQTILPALVLADAPSRLTLKGGTHNPHAPPFEFFAHAFLAVLNCMGVKVSASLQRPGFYPAGGGVVEIEITPAPKLKPLTITERGNVMRQYACAMVSHLPRHIAQRELDVIAAGLGLTLQSMEIREVDAYGPGNIVTVEIHSEHITEVFTGYGQRGLPAEEVAEGVVKQIKRYLAATVPVGEHLADQLLLPFALAGSGVFLTLSPSRHTRTNIMVIEAFLEVTVECKAAGEDRCLIQVK
jgi:RNA 3'-terminal phosphate cyclase (ATP)